MLFFSSFTLSKISKPDTSLQCKSDGQLVPIPMQSILERVEGIRYNMIVNLAFLQPATFANAMKLHIIIWNEQVKISLFCTWHFILGENKNFWNVFFKFCPVSG